jgi:16S rRNA (guanine527-N7)-methyltransferase
MERLLAGLARLGLAVSAEQAARFQVFYEELIEWNRRMNLTSIADYERVQIDHFLDALTVTLVWKSGPLTSHIIDVGTGAGIPGIPLKIMYPASRLTLLEATAKKCDFLRHVVGKLNLADTLVVAGRAEDMAHKPDLRESFDLVLARAVAETAALAELTLPFCATGGLVVLHKKGDIEAELDRARDAVGTLGGRLREVRPVDLPEFTDRRVLVVIEKVRATPDKYPRRAGMPEKRPIGR